jgi:HAD superfamily hydrolase (TIGR01450 family)
VLRFDGLIVDLDGVVWRGPDAIPGSVEALHMLRDEGVDLVFLTNDPRGSRHEYAARLAEMGFDAIEAQVITAGSALAALIRQSEQPATTAFVIGSASLHDEIEGAGMELVAGDHGRVAEIVVVGGHEGFDFEELRTATQALRRGARLYGAGRDATFPMPDGPWPATGSILAAVEMAGGVKATIAGKPEAFVFDLARRLLSDCRSVAIVGDDLEADIAGGKGAGLFTALVLTGTSSRTDVAQARIQPDTVLEDLAGLARDRGVRNG